MCKTKTYKNNYLKTCGYCWESLSWQDEVEHKKSYLNHLRELFEAIDVSAEGMISRDTLQHAFKHETIVACSQAYSSPRYPRFAIDRSIMKFQWAGSWMSWEIEEMQGVLSGPSLILVLRSRTSTPWRSMLSMQKPSSTCLITTSLGKSIWRILLACKML